MHNGAWDYPADTRGYTCGMVHEFHTRNWSFRYGAAAEPKYGIGLNFEQEISHDAGVFARLGWNDGKTESFAFTAIDRLATGGVSVRGTPWKRKDDVAATAFTASGLAGVHALHDCRAHSLRNSFSTSWITSSLPEFVRSFCSLRKATPSTSR